MSAYKAKILTAIGLVIEEVFLTAHFFSDEFLDSIPPKPEFVEFSEIECAKRESKKAGVFVLKLKIKALLYKAVGSSLAMEI